MAESEEVQDVFHVDTSVNPQSEGDTESTFPDIAIANGQEGDQVAEAEEGAEGGEIQEGGKHLIAHGGC